MTPDENQPTSNTPSTNEGVPVISNGQRIIQPSAGFVKEMHTEQQASQSAKDTTSQESVSASTQSITPPAAYPQPTDVPNSQMPTGVSASQMGWNQSTKSRKSSVKKRAAAIIICLAALGGLFAVLVAMNIIPFSTFRPTDYTDGSGTNYTVRFYTRHTAKTLSNSGDTQLISAVSSEGKFPLTFMISSSKGDTTSIYPMAKNCKAPYFEKEFDVQNDNLHQSIAVCNASMGSGGPHGVYMAGITVDDQPRLIVISQDLSSADTSSKSAAQESSSKFGLDPYQDDIKAIVSSINVK